jgi:hypothetical protein
VSVQDPLRDLVLPAGDVDPPLDLWARIEHRADELGRPGRRPRVARPLRWALAAGGCLLVIAALAIAAHSRDTTPPHPASPTRVIHDDNVSLRLPRGWQGQALQGRLQIRDYNHGRWAAPPPGHVWAAIDEESRGFALGGGLPFPPLSGPLTIRPGEYSTPELGGGDLGAARTFRLNGRYFELMVIFGDKHPAPHVVNRLNHVLRTLAVGPALQSSAPLPPPAFSPAAGWQTGHSRGAPTQPQGDQLCAWASTIRYRDPNACPIAAYTINALRPGQMVISVAIHRDWGTLGGPRLPAHPVVPAKLGPTQEGGRRSATIYGTRSTYTVEINVWVGYGQPFTAAMHRRAQQEIDRLALPAWPPFPR